MTGSFISVVVADIHSLGRYTSDTLASPNFEIHSCETCRLWVELLRLCMPVEGDPNLAQSRRYHKLTEKVFWLHLAQAQSDVSLNPTGHVEKTGQDGKTVPDSINMVIRLPY